MRKFTAKGHKIYMRKKRFELCSNLTLFACGIAISFYYTYTLINHITTI